MNIRLFSCCVLSLFSILVSHFSYSSTLYLWDRQQISGVDTYGAAHLACNAYKPTLNQTQSYAHVQESSTSWRCGYNNAGSYVYLGIAVRYSVNCPYGDNGTSCNASCDPPKTMVGGQCVEEPSCPPGQYWDSSLNPPVCVALDGCAGKVGQSTGFKISGNQSDANAFYKPVGNTWISPNQIKSGPGACNATVAGGTRCTVYADGAYTCVGTAVYDGTSGDGSPLPLSDECEDCPEEPVTPTAGTESSCSNWVEDSEGRRTRTCETKAEANKPGRAKCLTDGSLVCVSADPTPESDTKTRTDQIKETPNPDGGKTTETTSTTTKVYCSAGACTTTNTTNKTTVVTNGSGEVVSENGTCEGDDCGDPESPEEESGELPGAPEMPEIGEDGDLSYGDALSDFTDRVGSSPLVSAVGNIAFPASGGSCTMGSASLWGGSVSFNHFCDMAPTVLGGLRYLFLSIWAIAAVRLFMTA